MSLGALAAIAVIAVLLAFPKSQPADETPDVPLAVEPSPTATQPPSTATSEPQPTPGPGIDIERILIPGLDIDAPIVTMGVDPDGTMQSPHNPVDVAWYGFSGRAGQGTNIVMSGNTIMSTTGPAVFYRLKEAQAGEEVRLVLVDGSVARYRVTGVTIGSMPATRPAI